MPDRPLVIYLLPTHQQSDLSTADVATFMCVGDDQQPFFDRSALLTLAEHLSGLSGSPWPSVERRRGFPEP